MVSAESLYKMMSDRLEPRIKFVDTAIKETRPSNKGAATKLIHVCFMTISNWDTVIK